MIESSSPNFTRSAAATSGGTLGLEASSPNGSPGASASTMNSTRLMPSRLGTAISNRRSRYRLTGQLPGRQPSPTQPCGLGPPSPAMRERGFEKRAYEPLSCTAGEGAERSEAGEGARPSRLAVPVLQVPEVVVPSAQLCLELMRDGRHPAPTYYRDHHNVFYHHVVHRNEQCRALDRIELALGRAKHLVVFIIMPASRIVALPFIFLRGDFPRHELLHESFRIGNRRRADSIHLDICVELPRGIRICRIGREIDRRRHRLELNIDPGLLAGLLDDRLSFLARRIDRSLENEFELFAVLGGDAVGAALPAGLIQQLVRLVDIELPFGVLRNKPLRVVEKIAGRGPGTPIDVRFDRGAIDKQAKGQSDRGITEQRMRRFGARPLAVDFGPGIGVVELDMLDASARHHLDAPPRTAPAFQSAQDFVFD